MCTTLFASTVRPSKGEVAESHVADVREQANHLRVVFLHAQGPTAFPLARFPQNTHLLGNNSETYRQIMATADPKKQKDLGRGVKGFIPAVWDELAYDVVVEGNLAKFRQNPRFREELLATGDRVRTIVALRVCEVWLRCLCLRPADAQFHVRGGSARHVAAFV